MAAAASWLGRSIERFEDAALLTGRGRYIDDLGVPPGTLHAAILRSSHAHAAIRAIRTEAAAAAAGVAAVIAGAEVTALSASLAVGVRAPIESWPIAVGRVRYMGEPVAVVVAADRYLAEDALDLIEVDYDPLPAIVDPLAALDGVPLLHDKLGSNVASDRTFRYGDPETAFDKAAHRIAVDIRYILANFMGPFSLHPVMARPSCAPVPPLPWRDRPPPHTTGGCGLNHGVHPGFVASRPILPRPRGATTDRGSSLDSAWSPRARPRPGRRCAMAKVDQRGFHAQI